MGNRLPLVMAVDGLAYSGGEMADLLKRVFDQSLKVDFQLISPLRVVEAAKRQKPDLIIIGYLPLPDQDYDLSCVGASTGADLVKNLKSDTDTRLIPILMISGFSRTPEMLALVDPELEEPTDEALPFGVDAYLSAPLGPADLVDTVKPLIGERSSITDQGRAA